MSNPDGNERTTAGRPEISDEKIGGILRLTGPRPAVPEDRTLRVKAAVRARWLAEKRRPSTPRRVLSVAALAAAAALAVVVGREWRQARMPRVEALSGPASIRPAPDSPAIEIRAGHDVPAGSRLETAEDGRLALRMSSGASLRLDVGTMVEIRTDRTLALLAGAVYVDAAGRADPAAPDAGSIEIHTPAGRVREIGTQFEVRLMDATVRLRVREGLVTVDRPSGSLEVRSGRELRVEGDGTTSSRDLPIHGAEWAWTEAIAPMMEIEGRSLREFLDWAARERGLGVRFAGGDLDAAAAAIRLNGSIQGLTLDQALETVLLTCRMRPRVEGDLLIAEADDGAPGPPDL